MLDARLLAARDWAQRLAMDVVKRLRALAVERPLAFEVAGAVTNGGPRDNRSAGSIVKAPKRALQWRCGPVTRPVAPTFPISWPFSTVSPIATSGWLIWK